MGFYSHSGSGGLTPSLDNPHLPACKVQVQGLKTKQRLIVFSLRLGLVKSWAKHFYCKYLQWFVLASVL